MNRLLRCVVSFCLPALALVLTGCVTYESLGPEALPREAGFTPADTIEPWWRLFDDPELDGAMERMLGQNLDLVAAKSRILQAEYAMLKSGASLKPSLDATLGVSRSVNRFENGTIAAGEISGSLRAGYELDLFGRLEDLAEASRLDWRQRRFDYRTAAILLSCEFAENWYGLAYAEESVRFLKERVDVAAKEAALLQKRYEAQRVKMVDLLSQKSALKQTQSDLIDYLDRRRLYRNALAALLGVDPGRLRMRTPTSLPGDPELPLPEEVSSEVLWHRPDIQASYTALMALDRRAAAAVSAQYPRFSLSAAVSENDMRFNNLFNLWYTSVAATMAAPLLDGGSREADARIALERRKEALLILKRELVDAAVEVNNAVETIRNGQKAYRLTLEKLEIDEKRVRSYENGYLHGTEDFKRYLDARLALLSSRLEEIRVRYDLLKAYIGYYRATASEWRGIEPGKDEREETE